MADSLSFWQQLDALVAQQKQSRATQPKLPMKGKLKQPRTPMTMVEMMIVDKLQNNVRFPPATGPKRFIHGLTINSELSDRGRQYLAFIAHRFRKQWRATQEEFEWIVKWKKY